MSDLQDLKLRELYLQRRAINHERDARLHDILTAIGREDWVHLQRKTQRNGLLTVIKSQLKYIATLEDEGKLYEFDLVMEDIRKGKWFENLLKSSHFDFLKDIGIGEIDSVIKRIDTEMLIISRHVDELLGGCESEAYVNYLEYSRLGSESTQIKIHMNNNYGKQTASTVPRFFN